MKKNQIAEKIFILLPFLFLFASCMTVKEDNDIDLSYDTLIKKRGIPSYSLYLVIEKDHQPAEYEPNFKEFFSEDELENSVMVRYASWKKTHTVLIVWFKNVDNVWISFSSTEYSAPFIK